MPRATRKATPTPRFDGSPWKPLRAVGYVRVSTEEQVRHGHGLDMQRSDIQGYCEANGIELVDIVSDEGLSATLDVDMRPGLCQAIAATASGEADAVVVRSIDRIARDGYPYYQAKRLINDAGGRILSITQPDLASGTAVSDLLESVLMGVAKMERGEIVRKMRSGRLAKARKGGYAGGRIPFGYRLVRDGEGSTLVVSEESAAVVRRIFAERAAGRTYRAIAAGLTEDGIPTSRGASTWAPDAVHTIVGNPAYVGRRRWMQDDQTVDVEGAIPPIVEPSVWDACHPPLSCESTANEPTRL